MASPRSREHVDLIISAALGTGKPPDKMYVFSLTKEKPLF
jgi:hypothetical protein